MGIAPEGHESLTGSLKAGTKGAAYLAIKSGAPILPVTFTGAQNRVIVHYLMRLKHSPVTITIGKTFFIKESADRKEPLRLATDKIMHTPASQLPQVYQGEYSVESEASYVIQEH
jgi:1-acyl-sn-glycerol-3-phosphate acyltransferase